jgi:hypothetical protein
VCACEVTHKDDNTQIYTGHEHIERGTTARLAFVRNGLCRGVDASTEPEAGDLDTSLGYRRMVGGGSVGGGGGDGVGRAGMGPLKGLRTPKNPGVPASAASAAFAAFVAVLPSGNTETEGSRRVHRIPGAMVQVQVQVRVETCVGDIHGQRGNQSIQA